MMQPAYRNEWKFLLNNGDYRQLQQVLRGMLKYDSHAGPEGGYHIRSLYFDDLYRTAYRQKMAGLAVRKKYRVRAYNCDPARIALECKHKNGAFICKESIDLSPAEYRALLQGDIAFLPRRGQPVADRFFLESRTRVLRPFVTVAYDREAFVCKAGTVRITFDRNLTAIPAGQDLFDPHAVGYHVLPPGQMILEVKFTGFLPEHIRRIFQAYTFVRTSASKFCLCADRVSRVLH